MTHFLLRCLPQPLLGVIAILLFTTCPSLWAHSQSIIALQKKFAALEQSNRAKLGIVAINTANNQQIRYRADERFPIQSTFKLLVVGEILKQSMIHPQLLKEKITYKQQDLVFWSPITEKNVADGMTIEELSAAAMMYSDNTATNLLMKKLGGPHAVTTFAHSLGESLFRIDSWEPNLNSNPAEKEDTATPAAMSRFLQQFTLGTVLQLAQRDQLLTWMKHNTTGNTRIRAGVPAGWIVADKTGSGDNYGVSNDIAILWPPHRAPVVLIIYSVHNQKTAAPQDDLLVSLTRLIIQEFGLGDSRSFELSNHGA